jgi:hypothetical protein
MAAPAVAIDTALITPMPTSTAFADTTLRSLHSGANPALRELFDNANDAQASELHVLVETAPGSTRVVRCHPQHTHP